MLSFGLHKKFGDHIRHLRKQKDWTQETLGEKANLDWRYVGDVERGEKSPTLETIRKLAKALKISLAELFSSFK